MAKTISLFTGAQMPTIGLGTWKSAPGAVRAAVVAAIEAGYRHIDCAAAYGNEEEVGAALQEVFTRGLVRRSDVFLTSKLWASKCYPEDVHAALEATLAALKVEYLDLYLIHWPFFLEKGASFPPEMAQRKGYSRDAYLSVWRKLEEEVDAGHVRHIGTSNMSAKKLADLLPAARIQPAVNQVESHPFLAQKPLVDFCRRHNIVFTAYSPLGSPDRPSRLAADADPAPLHDATVHAIATRHGATPAQVLLRWAVQRGTVAIPKSVTPSRIAENIAAYNVELTAEDMAALNGLDSGARLIKGDPFVTAEMTSNKDLWDLDFDHSVTVPRPGSAAAAV